MLKLMIVSGIIGGIAFPLVHWVVSKILPPKRRTAGGVTFQGESLSRGLSILIFLTVGIFACAVFFSLF